MKEVSLLLTVASLSYLCLWSMPVQVPANMLKIISPHLYFQPSLSPKAEQSSWKNCYIHSLCPLVLLPSPTYLNPALVPTLTQEDLSPGSQWSFAAKTIENIEPYHTSISVLCVIRILLYEIYKELSPRQPHPVTSSLSLSQTLLLGPPSPSNWGVKPSQQGSPSPNSHIRLTDFLIGLRVTFFSITHLS